MAENVDLVCEGGGVKGIALVGAISVLEERGYGFQNLAGTSAGAIVATLVAAGYSSDELRDVLRTTQFSQFTDPTILDQIPLVGKPINVLSALGVYRGNYFLKWMRDHLAAKNVKTFGQLVHPDYAGDERYRYKVQVIASDVTTHELLVLPRDAGKLGVEPDDLEVALAVRMSMSIPIFFEPVRFKNRKTGATHLIVDGGMLSNFPVWLFDSDGPPPWPTFGLKLVAEDPKATPPGEALGSHLIPPAIGYLKNLVGTMTEAHDRLYLEEDTFVRTITIPTLGVTATQFTLPPETSDALFDAGRAAAQQFLKTWSFPAYVAEYRSGKDHSRRAKVALR